MWNRVHNMLVFLVLITLFVHRMSATISIATGLPRLSYGYPGFYRVEPTTDEIRQMTGTGRIVTPPNSDHTVVKSEVEENNCNSSGWYTTDDGKIYRCDVREDNVEPSLHQEASWDSQTHVLVPGLPGIDWMFVNKKVSDGHSTAHLSITTEHKPILPFIKPLELKPVIYKPVIKPVHKPLVLKPIVYKPVIQPVHKPLVIKPLIHSPVIIETSLHPHAIKPTKFSDNKAETLNSQLEEQEALKKPESLSPEVTAAEHELHQTGLAAVNRPAKKSDQGIHPIETPFYTYSQTPLFNLFPSLRIRPYISVPSPLRGPFVVRNELCNEREVVAANKVGSGGEPSYDKNQPNSDTELEDHIGNNTSKTISELKGVIKNIKLKMEKIPYLIGIKGHSDGIHGSDFHHTGAGVSPVHSHHDHDGSVHEHGTHNVHGTHQHGIHEEHGVIHQLSKSDSAIVEDSSLRDDSSKSTTDGALLNVDPRTAELTSDSGSENVTDPINEERRQDITDTTEGKSGSTEIPEETTATIPESSHTLAERVEDVDKDMNIEEGEEHIRTIREAPSIPIEILHDQEKPDPVLDRTTLLKILSALKEQYMKTAEPDQRKTIEDAFDRLYCSVREMKKLEERPIGKKMDGPKKATLELLAERSQPLLDETDYYNDATDDVSAEPSFLELIDVATKHKGKQSGDSY